MDTDLDDIVVATDLGDVAVDIVLDDAVTSGDVAARFSFGAVVLVVLVVAIAVAASAVINNLQLPSLRAKKCVTLLCLFSHISNSNTKRMRTRERDSITITLL